MGYCFFNFLLWSPQTPVPTVLGVTVLSTVSDFSQCVSLYCISLKKSHTTQCPCWSTHEHFIEQESSNILENTEDNWGSTAKINASFMNCILFLNFSDDLVERMGPFIINSIIHTWMVFWVFRCFNSHHPWPESITERVQPVLDYLKSGSPTS